MNYKKIIFILYTLIVVCIGFATIIEKIQGSDYVNEHIYEAWWFSALWALLTIAGCFYIVKCRLYKRIAVALLHVSFVVILIGALITHLFVCRGTVHLRTGVNVTTYSDKAGLTHSLPFSLKLKEFRIVNYPGTDAPFDYQSFIQHPGGEIVVSMNKIGYVKGYRLYQSNYDSDGEGVSLGMNYDPYGIAVTYLGYLMLLTGIMATLLSRKTQIRILYRKAVTLILLLLSVNVSANDSIQIVNKDIAHRMGTINVLYNNRICPLNTVATDFVLKLTGNSSWNGFSADEIFVSWMIYYYPWERQKLIRVKSREVQHLLNINEQWASYSDFINEYHEYKLKDYIEALSTGNCDMDKKALMDADEKFHLVEMFYRGQFLRMFPYRSADKVNWYAPGGQSLPKNIPVKEQFFIKQSMDFLTECIVTGQQDRTFEIIAKIKLFQYDMLGELLPTGSKTRIEVFYNTIRSQKWPVFLALLISLLLCIAMFCCSWKRLAYFSLLFVILLLSYTTLLLGLRWWLGNHIPISNGHETMMFMAWVILLLTVFIHKGIRGVAANKEGEHRFHFILGFGPLIGSLCILVAMMAGNNSQMTPLMPVLQSPLLSVHVMTVMCAYSIFALQLLLGIQAFVLMKKKKTVELARTTAISQFLLYPAVFLLAIGIFLGAVWANVSWGNYWSWDPKESWALITLMVYAVPFHNGSIGFLRRPFSYHLYMVCAFFTVIVTYFGVNYLLGGMHSYM